MCGKMMEPKVSVIVPIYKAEKYIERCCASLFGQTLDCIEYIFVDDKSPDDSIRVVQNVLIRYPHRNGWVKIIVNEENKGVAYSRQKGLEAATGEFVIHCDSDDWVDADAYSIAYNCAVQENADVVRFGHIVEYSDGCKHECSYPSKDFFTKQIGFNISPQTGSVWGGLVRRYLLELHSIKFPQNTNWGEDFCVSIASLLVSRKTICLSECYYHYWQNSESITHTITKEKCLELVKIGGIVEEFLKSVGLLSKYTFQLNYLKFQSKAVLLRDKSVRDFSLWESIYPECHKDVMKYDYPFYFKVASWLVLNDFKRLACFLFLLKDKKDNL